MIKIESIIYYLFASSKSIFSNFDVKRDVPLPAKTEYIADTNVKAHQFDCELSAKLADFSEIGSDINHETLDDTEQYVFSRIIRFSWFFDRIVFILLRISDPNPCDVVVPPMKQKSNKELIGVKFDLDDESPVLKERKFYATRQSGMRTVRLNNRIESDSDSEPSFSDSDCDAAKKKDEGMTDISLDEN